MKSSLSSRDRNSLMIGLIGSILALSSLFLPILLVTSEIVAPHGEEPGLSVTHGLGGFEGGSVVWSAELLMMVTTIVAILFIFRPQNPFGGMMPLSMQIRRASDILVGGGILSFLFMLGTFFSLPSPFHDALDCMQLLSRDLQPGLSLGYTVGIGGYLFLLGAIMVIAAGVYMKSKQSSVAEVQKPAD